MNVTAAIEVLAPGALTCVQDGGRHGHRALGVGRSGAADTHSAALANLLVGNSANLAVFEITLSGPRLRFHQAAWIALAGADIDARCGADALPAWRPLWMPRGAELQLGACRRGVRSYLAVRGGIEVPALLGSRATDLRAGFGGCEGRALRTGDRLRSGVAAGDDAWPMAPAAAAARADRGRGTGKPAIARWWIDPAPDLDLALPAVAALLPGSAELDPAAHAQLLEHAWKVAADSNRIGLRLAGPALALAHAWEHPSEPVFPGTVQLPPDGQPIVLLADCGTTGGYPRIGHVADVDLPRLAQLRPGETMRFVPSTLEEVDARGCARAARLARIALAIEARTRQDSQSA